MDPHTPGDGEHADPGIGGESVPPYPYPPPPPDSAGYPSAPPPGYPPGYPPPPPDPTGYGSAPRPGYPPGYPPPPYPPYPPYATLQKVGTNGFAIASLACGIGGIVLFFFGIGSILALVFGYVARGQIKRSGGTQGGRGMAIAGIVLGWIGVAFILLVIVLAIIGASTGS
jgi:hypothetical protein